MKTAGKISLIIVVCISLVSLCAPLLSQYNPNMIDLDGLRQPPSLQHLMGTDTKGRDILSRVLHGGRISLGVALTAAFVSMCIGLAVGLISGYFGGKADTVIMAFVDLILSFPTLLLAIGISVIFPPSIYTVMIAIAAVGWAPFARLIRGYVLSLRGELFMDAARVVGCGTFRIITKHLMPQCVPLLIVMMGMKLSGYILTEAALSFLGLGAQPPTATWGSMISANRAYIASSPWMVFFPGFMIALTAFCFNTVGDTLRDKYGLKV
jgi:ABC-type dipeptide/oligopeptide/nickel transport system permease subunit